MTSLAGTSRMSEAFLSTGQAAREMSLTLNLRFFTGIDDLDATTVTAARGLIPGWAGTFDQLVATARTVAA